MAVEACRACIILGREKLEGDAGLGVRNGIHNPA
jgi:hypothetical protein